MAGLFHTYPFLFHAPGIIGSTIHESERHGEATENKEIKSYKKVRRENNLIPGSRYTIEWHVSKRQSLLFVFWFGQNKKNQQKSKPRKIDYGQ